VEKFKRTLNLECNPHPLFEPSSEYSLAQIKETERMKGEHVRENQRVNVELLREYQDKMDMRIMNSLSELGAQETKEEISLLGYIGGQFFQGIPTYHYV
jgi:diaminopimelate epimerase